MSNAAPAWFQPYYTDKVIHKLQNRGFKLKGMTSEATEIVGNECHWRIAATIEARLYARGSDAVLANGDRTKVQVTMETWQVYDIVYDDDLSKMTPNEMEVVTLSGARALGRRFDLQIYDAMNTDAPAAAVTDTTNGMTLANAMALVEAAQIASEGEWGDAEWYCGLHSRLWNQLLAYKQFNSADWVGDTPLVRASDSRNWNGVKWFLGRNSWFPVPSANQADVFLWSKDCVGYGSNYSVKNNVEWEQPKTAWTANMRMAGKAKVLLSEGVVRGRFNTNAAIAPNN
jgi:hypothetical protein